MHGIQIPRGGLKCKQKIEGTVIITRLNLNFMSDHKVNAIRFRRSNEILQAYKKVFVEITLEYFVVLYEFAIVCVCMYT